MYFNKTMAYISRPFKRFLQALLVFSLLVAPFSAFAEKGGYDASIIIRDAEIENTLKGWLAPLLKIAGLNPEGVKIVIVQNSQLNAFVAGGSNIFIYTGLIERTQNPGELIGVMAHELGHIAGGHLVATRGAFERASYESILGTVLGIGAAIATGSGQAANAIISGGNALAANHFLTHSRVQESAADQAALRFMDGAQYSPTGLASFFEKLESEELLPVSEQSAYMRTHPLTRDRIELIETKTSISPYKDKPFPAQWTDEHARMKAKLLAFINPAQVAWQYNDSDKSVSAQYARAIASYRENNVARSLKEIDSLIAEEPSNPYFQELKGQMLVDFGRVGEAIPYYRQAVRMLPESGLIRMALGHALLESGNDPQTLKEGADNIERALRDEPRSTRAHRLLATAYGKMGQENRAKLELAEEAVLQRRLDDAKAQAKSVLQSSEKGSREAIQARDILVQIDALKKDEDYKD